MAITARPHLYLEVNRTRNHRQPFGVALSSRRGDKPSAGEQRSGHASDSIAKASYIRRCH